MYNATLATIFLREQIKTNLHITGRFRQRAKKYQQNPEIRPPIFRFFCKAIYLLYGNILFPCQPSTALFYRQSTMILNICIKIN